MSLEAMVWALKTPAKDPLARIVLIALANYADSYGRNSWPSQETLLGYVQCSRRGLQVKLRELESAGLIRRGNQNITHHLPANRRPVVWDLAVWGAYDAPLDAVDNSAYRGAPRAPQGETWGAQPGTSEAHPGAHNPVLEPSPPTPSDHCERHAVHRPRCVECQVAQKRYRIAVVSAPRCSVCGHRRETCERLSGMTEDGHRFAVNAR